MRTRRLSWNGYEHISVMDFDNEDHCQQCSLIELCSSDYVPCAEPIGLHDNYHFEKVMEEDN